MYVRVARHALAAGFFFQFILGSLSDLALPEIVVQIMF